MGAVLGWIASIAGAERREAHDANQHDVLPRFRYDVDNCRVGAQVRVLGATLGEWGREKYGLKPVKRDALEYLPEYLAHLRDLIKEEQAAALDKNAPCAFVTFRCGS
jgi:hypothetical protein